MWSHCNKNTTSSSQVFDNFKKSAGFDNAECHCLCVNITKHLDGFLILVSNQKTIKLFNIATVTMDIKPITGLMKSRRFKFRGDDFTLFRKFDTSWDLIWTIEALDNSWEYPDMCPYLAEKQVSARRMTPTALGHVIQTQYLYSGTQRGSIIRLPLSLGAKVQIECACKEARTCWVVIMTFQQSGRSPKVVALFLLQTLVAIKSDFLNCMIQSKWYQIIHASSIIILT